MTTRIGTRSKKSAEAVSPEISTKAPNRRNGGPGGGSAIVEPQGPVFQLLRSRVDHAIDDYDTPDVLIATLVAMSSQRSETEAGTLKTYAFRRLRDSLDTPSARRKTWTWTRMSAARPEIEARELACALLDTFWREHRREVERITLNMARDEEREVRLYAASTMARIIRANFRAYFRYLRAWSRHPDPSVRRQVIIATVAVADSDHPEWAKSLLDLLEPHLTDRDPYVRRNLGPFALGQGLLRVYPDATLERFRKWLDSDNEIVRWNLAMAFTAPVAPLEWEQALEILRVLAADTRRFVWGAAAMALRNLAVLRPRRVQPVLKRWMKDPALRVAVSTAFNSSVR